MTLKKKIQLMRKQLDANNSSDSEEIDDDLEEITEIKEPIYSDLNNGMFVLVKFPSEKNKKINYTYVCTIQMIHDDKHEIVVMALHAIDTANTVFVVDEADISSVSFDQIVGILEEPILQCSGARLKYKFRTKIPVCEK